MPAKILGKIVRAGKTIASRVLSEKVGEEVWVIEDHEIWDLFRDGRAKYSILEMPEVAKMTLEQVKKNHQLKKIYPGMEIVDVVNKNNSNKGTDR
jgi:hypothetical protein